MTEKIILIKPTKDGKNYQARLFGKNPPLQAFAKTEVEALNTLVEKIKLRNKNRIQ